MKTVVDSHQKIADALRSGNRPSGLPWPVVTGPDRHWFKRKGDEPLQDALRSAPDSATILALASLPQFDYEGESGRGLKTEPPET
jgi:hypothetical protein